MVNKRLIEIFKDTQKIYQSDEELLKSIEYSLNFQKIILEDDKIDFSCLPRFKNQAKIKVTKSRTLEATSKYKGEKIGVLNFASFTHPGGGVAEGSKAQEESICRCSTLYPCISHSLAQKDFYHKHANTTNLYNNDCIYTPDVKIFKKDKFYPELMNKEDWFEVDVITCAAPNLRGNKGFNEKELLKIFVERITRILQIAKNNNVDVLILGAFGCGAFKNPPEIVAEAFKIAIKPFLYDFKLIDFAIYSSSHDTNYQIFKEKFYPSLTKEIESEINDLFWLNKNMEQISDIIDIPVSTISYWLRQGKKGRKKYKDFYEKYKDLAYTPPTFDVYERAYREVLAGKRCFTIEEDFNLKKGSLKNWIKKNIDDRNEIMFSKLKVQKIEDGLRKEKLDDDFTILDCLADFAQSHDISLPELFFLMNKYYREQLNSIERKFHNLILNHSIKKEYLKGIHLPRLDFSLLNKNRYFPIPGMYGGFLYTLEYDNFEEKFVLYVSSWSRIVENSERSYKITEFSCELIE